jgi:hypothetical protein
VRAAPLALALLAACGLPEPAPEHRVRLERIAPEGTVAPGPVTLELAFSGPVLPEGLADGRRLALCRGADADAVAAAAGSEAGLGPGDPVLAAQVELLDGGRRVRLVPARPLWPMASWALVVGKGVRDQEGRAVLDPQGRLRTVRHLFDTGDLPPGALPALVLTEALARATPPAAGGEYAEVQNLGQAPAELAGFRLAKRTASGAVQRCALEPADAGPIPPRGRALVAGGGLDGRYRLPAALPVYRCGASALLGGLADDRPVALALESPGGVVLSSLGWAAPAPLCAEGALERIHPSGPDAPANLLCPGLATPGACNASTPAGECP